LKKRKGSWLVLFGTGGKGGKIAKKGVRGIVKKN